MAYIARATTNSIGKTVGNYSEFLGSLTCKTDSFIVPSKNNDMFAGEAQCRFEFVYRTDIGRLLSSGNDKLNIIGQHMFNSGMNLRAEVSIMKSGKSTEVWTSTKRYKCIKGRAYYKLLDN